MHLLMLAFSGHGLQGAPIHSNGLVYVCQKNDVK